MSGVELAMWWLVAAIGLGGSMLCSGMETGLYATSSVRAFIRARSAVAGFGDRVVASALDHPERSLTTLLLFNNAFNYLGTLAVTALLATLGLSEAAMVLLQAAVLTPVLLVFAESLPKELFRANADRAVRAFAPALHGMMLLGLVTGVVPGIVLLSRLLGRVLGADAAGALSTPRARSAEMIKHGSPALSEAQAGLVDRALAVETTRVREEMVPIQAAACLRAGWTFPRVRAFVAKRPHSLYPVLDDQGRVVGIASMLAIARGGWASVGVLAEPATMVAFDATAWDALGTLRDRGAQMGIVERGGQAVGIVTQKDLVEPLIGDLRAW
ncbi:MAG: DUF21 domain-containing protein [Planctomycetota bacterium]|nr:MAG: DUF21 domain-containing protein [Planctomycetota bacterium]